MQKNTQSFIIKDEFSLEQCHFPLLIWDRVFFYGDLGAWKSTFIRSLLRKISNNQNLIVRSPTYTYYEKYVFDNYPPIYHCDLYRIEDYDTFVSIGGEEIADDEKNIMLIEWPERLEWRVIPTKIVRLELKENCEREISISWTIE
jgi:tRNA threonylcarbamoyladenosine biosynthesis protein TsaE